MKIIAVITGGYSQESVISYRSAEVVMKYIDRELYEPLQVALTKEGWLAEYEGKNYPINKADFSFNYSGRKITFDAAFIALHGSPGEDGQLQAYFDLIGLPYNTCGAVESTITFNKNYCNRLLSTYGITVAKSYALKSMEDFKPKKIVKDVGIPCFVKPNCGGSSFGVTKVVEKEQLEEAVQRAFEVDDEVVIEKFISGTEITCAVWSVNGKPKSLGVTEIVAANEWFDFESKYNSKETQEITPARIAEKQYKRCEEQTEKIYKWLNCRGFIRADYILTKEKELYLIEVNTVPGLTEESILPKMAAHSKVSLSDLFNTEIARTLNQHG